MAERQENEKKTSHSMSRQTAFLLALAMLMVGFVGGVAFSVLRAPALPGQDSAASAKETTEMIKALEAEAAKNSQDVNLWVQLGNAYFDTDQYVKAIGAYEKSLTIAPGDPNVLTDQGIMYRLNKQPDKAVETFDKAMALDPKHEPSRMNKGIVLLYDLEDEKGAIAAWEDLLALNPLAKFVDGQTVEERVRHYKEGHDNVPEGWNTTK